MEERRTDLSGLLQYLLNDKSSVSGIDFIAVLSSTKCCKLIVNLLVRLGASNPTALLASNGSENSFRNEFSMEIDSQISKKANPGIAIPSTQCVCIIQSHII